jgi:flagella basal body P-ring formation protein FlgA
MKLLSRFTSRLVSRRATHRVTALAHALAHALTQRGGAVTAAWLSWLSLVLAAVVMGWSVSAHAQSAKSGSAQGLTYRTSSEADLAYVAQDWLNRNLPELARREQQATGFPLHLQATAGAPDARLRLAPCDRVEVFTPARLWGNSHLGLRCTQGATRWSVTVPVQVQAWGQAWTLRNDVLAGQMLTVQDLEKQEVDWAADPSPVLTQSNVWQGQVASRALRAGQTLRQNTLRAAKVFNGGAQVRVLVQGSGFQVSAQGRALTPGIVGQVAQIRMENGRVMNATVVDARTVRVEI